MTPIKANIIADGLNRDEFTEDRVLELRQELLDLGIAMPLLEADEREELRQDFLQDLIPGEDLWVFAYGSLMWNPAMYHAGIEIARIYGFHRQFCLSLPIGRGSIDQPGLMLGLAPGGGCKGAVIRIAADQIDSETQILWRREMLSNAYRAVWLPAYQGGIRRQAMTFVVNEDHSRYVGRLPRREQIHMIATAEGHLGRCRDYLFNTVTQLENMGIQESHLRGLLKEVDAYIPV